MRLASVPVPRVIAVCGAAYLTAILVLVVSRTPLGSGLFFATAVIAVASYAVTVARVWSEPQAPRRWFVAAILLAVGFRLPPAVAPVGIDSDMVRYLWDGRVQTLGYNPYAILPNDPALPHTHVDGSARMPSRNDRTPYPPAAQLFFRLVVSISDSTLAMKLALVFCDLLAMTVLWRWLVATGRPEWLTLTYAWNPLVVLEVAHSGHIDALGALWIVASAYWLTRRRTLLATLAFALAIATKLVPIVVAPLFVGRIRKRDAVAGVLFLALLYLPFSSGGDVPLGAVPNVVQRVRFNGPVFA
ncbi:MAG TPA: glycosyltransferase 87 family protein, partial [Vicinamibacterales bacterium]|nr:glycosyltransferase 87 family protein [Vicinamibacterales bacterium]